MRDGQPMTGVGHGQLDHLSRGPLPVAWRVRVDRVGRIERGETVLRQVVYEGATRTRRKNSASRSRLGRGRPIATWTQKRVLCIEWVTRMAIESVDDGSQICEGFGGEFASGDEDGIGHLGLLGDGSAGYRTVTRRGRSDRRGRRRRGGGAPRAGWSRGHAHGSRPAPRARRSRRRGLAANWPR